MELSQKIYELRTGSGLSQLDLAEKLGVSLPHCQVMNSIFIEKDRAV